MTYLQFHAYFIVPPILLLLLLGRSRPLRAAHPRAPAFLVALPVIALVYTTPWDNYLVWKGVWEYGEDRVVGTVGYVPIEEYLFFVLQPLLTGLWLLRFLRRPGLATTRRVRWVGAGVYGTAALAGLVLLRITEALYLGLILVWAMPVLALQWWYAGSAIWERRTAWMWGVVPPTVYLWVVDAIAIRSGIWRISDQFTLGPGLGSLPLEEAVFFLVTNLLIVQGLLLFLHPPGAATVPSRGDPAAPSAEGEVAAKRR